jgi:hypothetical protein
MRNDCFACIAKARGIKSRIAFTHTCNGQNKKTIPVAEAPEHLSEDQRERAAKLWIAAIIDSAGFPLFNGSVSDADARAIAEHVKKLMADFSAPGSTVTTDTASIIRYVKRYLK